MRPHPPTTRRSASGTRRSASPSDRIFKFGKEDNFWEHGSGPCGPCSEIYYDRGEKYGCGKPGCTVGCDCDRYMEVWNIVFSQFDNDGHGHYTELKQKNIDTGMGLERLACRVPGRGLPVRRGHRDEHHATRSREITGAHYGESHEKDVSLRVITDHIRSATFMICDGVLPSQRGPRLCAAPPAAPGRPPRQAAGRQPIRSSMRSCDTVVHENEGHYPELRRAAGLYHQGHPHRGGELRQDHRRRHADLRRHAGRPQGQGRDRVLRRGRLQAVRHLRLPHRPDGRDGGGARA